MSCQIKPTADIVDVPAIRRHLYPHDDNRGGEHWIQCCEISLSPTGDLLVLAREKRLVVLTGRWDSQTCRTQFIPTEGGYLDYRENVNAVLCLPIVVQSQSSQVGTDWTCIVLGFESGNVTFLTENCSVLLEEQLHNEPVESLKCQSQHSPRPDISPELKPEELYVIYPNNVCVIGGVHLFSVLRNCRSQLAKVSALGHSLESALVSTNPKKWGFTDQVQINDAAVVGLDLTNTFNHLLTASVCGGFETKYRAMPPHNSLVLAAGSKPFLGFHYALEGGSQPVLSDVAKAVANKLKSALPGWLTGSKSTPDKTQSVSSQPAEVMACRYGLCDLRRVANNVVLSPDRKLAVVSDALGRVLLIDTYRGIALRMFKGYREAQCAFIQVPDERKKRSSTKNAIALFLLIYSPKKGTIEIICAQQGTKIAAFTSTKHSVLLYINYGLMGFQTTSKSRYVCQYTCVLMDPSGEIKEIIIPYHFALSEKNSKRARDLHLLKRLKQFIKSSDYSPEKLLAETSNTCAELKTTEIKLQFIEMITSCKEMQPDVILNAADYFLEKILTQEGELDSDMKQLKLLCENVNLLTHFYVFISGVSDEELDLKNGNMHNPESASDTKLVLPQKEMNNLQKLLDLSTLNDLKEHKSVWFDEGFNFTISEFISIFDSSNPDCIKVKHDLSDLKMYQVAEKVFKRYVVRVNNYEDLDTHVKRSKIYPNDLFNMLLHYWVNRPLNMHLNLEKEMENFSQTLFTLTKSIPVEKLIAEYNSLSEFWVKVRELLANSPKPFPALMAAILCKSVAQRVENEKDLQHSGTSLEEENIEIWEKLSQESCQWTLIIGKLEDVSLLNIILANKPVCESLLPKLQYDRPEVSLKYILEKGKGSVSEIVSQWLTMGGVSPESIILNDLSKNPEQENPSQSTEPELCKNPSQSSEAEVCVDQNEDDPIFYQLNIIKKQFPYSLEPSMLLTNMCWEYALAWQKNIQEINLLEASISCLNHIPNFHIKVGLYNLMWNTHLKIVFESACKLINKVGKLPKERLCRQDTDLSDYQITIFMNICTDFFNNFMETLSDSYNYEKPQIQYEPIWESDSKPLPELALTQNEINYDLLLLHYQLSLVMHMLTVFTVKHTKIISNLFDISNIPYFFTDLQQKASLNFHKTDSKVNTSRLQFLIKVISASMETVTIDDDKIYSTDHVSWMAKCVSLARFWNLDVDLLKRYQVTQIFSNGFDALGEELLPTITELEKLGPDLVSIAGKRLAQFLASSQDLGEKMGAFSTTLTKYLDTLDGEWHTPSDLESIMTLITHCLRCLEESQPEYKLACLMLEACSALQDLK